MAAFYGVLRLAYSMFYEQLGLRPEDVGLGYAEILSQTLSGLILMGTLFLVMMAGLVLFYAFLYKGMTDDRAQLAKRREPVASRSAGSRRRWAWPQVAVLILSLTLCTILALGFIVLVPGRIKDLLGTVIVAVVVMSLIGRGLVLSTRKGWREFARSIRVPAFVVLGISSILVFSTYFLAARLDGAAARRGHAVSSTLGPFPVASWGASHATVIWPTGAAPEGFPSDCLMYIGEGNGKTILFDVRGQRSVRVPSAGLIVLVDAEKLEDPSCRPRP